MNTKIDSHGSTAAPSKEQPSSRGRDAREGAHKKDEAPSEKTSGAGERGDHIKRGYAFWLDRAPPTATWREVMEAVKEYDSPAEAWPEEGGGSRC